VRAVSFLVARKEAVASLDWLERDVTAATGRMIDCDVYGRDQLRILMQRDALRNLMQEFVVTFARARFCLRGSSDSREWSVTRRHSENEKAPIAGSASLGRFVDQHD